MFALAPIILSVLAVSTAWTDRIHGDIEEDATITPPQILSIQPYEDTDSELTGSFWLFRFSLVPDATSYRIWREFPVLRGLEGNSNVVTLEELASQFVPWAIVDAPSNDDLGAFIVVSTLDGVRTNWGISALVERDGTLYRSPISYFDSSESLPTAVESKSWGQVKHRTIDP